MENVGHISITFGVIYFGEVSSLCGYNPTLVFFVMSRTQVDRQSQGGCRENRSGIGNPYRNL